MSVRYWSRKIIVVVVLFIVSFIFPSSVAGQEGDDDRHRQVPSLDVVLLIDESETMWRHTDTEGVRVNTVNFCIDILSSEQSGSVHRLGVVAFGTQPYVIPLTLLDSQEAADELKERYAAVHRSIELHKNEQYTDINAALRASLEMIEQNSDPNRKPTLILISDGQPTNPQVSEDKGRDTVLAYLDETRSLLQPFADYSYVDDICPSTRGAPLYMVGIGVDKLAESSSPDFIAMYKEFWQEVSGSAGGYYKEADRVEEMQGISTYIFSELLCTPATPALPVRSPQVLEYQVYENYFQIIFAISAKENPELETRVYRPQEDGTAGGVALSKDEEGVSWQSNGVDYEVWSVRYTEPWTGTWRVALEGDGRAEFSYIFFPNVTIHLYEPDSSFLPADEPFTVRAGIVDEDGQVVDVPLNDFRVEIEGEGGFRKQLSLEKDGDTFVAQLEPLGQTGEYSLAFNALLPDGTSLYEHVWVTLISAPWIELMEPVREASYEPVEPIPLQASVHLAGATSFEDIKLIATLLKDGRAVQTTEMRRGDTSNQAGEDVVAYSGAFRAIGEGGESGGEYEVMAEMMAILPGGRIFRHEIAPVPLSIVAPPPPTPSPTATAIPTPTSTPAPLATPTPVSFLASAARSPFCLPGLLVSLILALLIVLLWGLRRRRRRTIPNKIKLLAELMRSRRESGAPPYVLVLGSGPSVVLGSDATRRVVRAIAGDDDLGKFYEILDGLSSTERYAILKKRLAEASISSGHRCLAELVEKGFFDVVFTTNLDSLLESALAESELGATGFAVLVCGEQSGAETMNILDGAQPGVKIVKLHGDVRSRAFAFTPSEISLLGGEGERVLRRYLGGDVLIVGYGPRDYDISRAIEREGGAIWYIAHSPPAMDNLVYQAMRTRGAQANVVSGEFGLFDRFFEALHDELMRS